jgi:phage-related protein
MEILSLSNVRKTIESLDKSTRGKVLRIVDLLETREHHLGMPYSKMIDKGLYELRVQGAHNIRIFYSFQKDRIVLLHIISKKSQRISKNDLETAKQRMRLLQEI